MQSYEKLKVKMKLQYGQSVKYSKMAECLSLADVAKPYFSRSFMSSQCMIT